MAAKVQVATPEIRLHCGPTGLNEAVLSLDFLHPSVDAPQDAPLLATGGADKEIKLWRVGRDDGGQVALTFVFSLSGHDRSVNCVRFSPDGTMLASASDDMSIILWTKPKSAGPEWRWDQIQSLSDVARTILACGHKGDITDLSWSPDSAFLCSSSVDNRCVIWDVEKGDVAERRKDHTQYVQGVAWDPLNEYIVTEGNDRTCRVYSLSGFGTAARPNGKKQGRKFTCIQTLKTREFPSKKSPDKEDKETTEANTAVSKPAPKAPKHRMFLDDTCPAFARRLAWTPDGSYFLAPTGTFRAKEGASPVNTVYAFSRGNLSQPTLHLPSQEKASLAVRCSPCLYKLRSQNGEADNSPKHNFFKTQLRSVFAVITLDAVMVYDTQQAHPICTVKGLHYADLTDATWTSDGQMLSISSTDGYISFIRFDEGFFGEIVPAEEQTELNGIKEKLRRVYSPPKKSRKKVKSQASTNEPAPTKALTPKKKPEPVDPLKRAFQNASEKSGDGSAAKPINLLQVRKKRKISPTLVQPASAPSAPTAGPHATEATSTTAAAPTSAETPIDLSGVSTSDAATPETQPSISSTHAGTYDDPVDI